MYIICNIIIYKIMQMYNAINHFHNISFSKQSSISLQPTYVCSDTICRAQQRPDLFKTRIINLIP